MWCQVVQFTEFAFMLRSPGDVQNVEPVSFATKVCVFLWMLAVVKTQAEVKAEFMQNLMLG